MGSEVLFLSGVPLDPIHHDQDRGQKSAHKQNPKSAVGQVNFFDAGELHSDGQGCHELFRGPVAPNLMNKSANARSKLPDD